MARGIEVRDLAPVPVRSLGGEDPTRNEERFRAQVLELLRENERRIEEITERLEALEAGP